MLVEICSINVFHTKKLKKKKIEQKGVFWVCTRKLVEGLIDRKKQVNKFKKVQKICKKFANLWSFCNFFMFFSGNNTIDHHWGVNSNKTFLLNFAPLFGFFFLFQLLAWKTLKNYISTNICSAQHPNLAKIYNKLHKVKLFCD